MNSKTAFFLLFFCISIFAGSKGPSLSGASYYILNFTDDNGRWYPKTEWTVKGLNSGDELKTTLVDEKGTTLAFAVWNYDLNAEGDWSTITSIKQFGPTGHPASDYENLPRFKEGNYKLKISAADKVIWETDFEIIHTKYLRRDHFTCSGPWKSTAYFYCCGQYSGGIINFWFEGPKDLNWYYEIGVDYQRELELRTELKNEAGEVLIENGPEQYDDFVIYPGKCTKISKSTATSKPDFEQKILSKDGKYDVVVYAGNKLKGEWYPIVNMTFTVTNREILINEQLSGESSDPVHRLITTSAYYQTGVVKNTIPPMHL